MLVSKMVRHIVIMKLHGASDARRIFTALKNLQSQIPGIINIRCGSDCSPEGLQRGYTHGFTVDFADTAARDIYLTHPAHQKVGVMIVGAAEGGLDGILVLDWEI
jgi:Stress responsive A/B Barrel Domain